MPLKRVNVFTIEGDTAIPSPGPGAANFIYDINKNKITAVIGKEGKTQEVSQGGDVINDSITGETSTWSSQKIKDIFTPEQVGIIFNNDNSFDQNNYTVNSVDSTISFNSTGVTFVSGGSNYNDYIKYNHNTGLDENKITCDFTLDTYGSGVWVGYHGIGQRFGVQVNTANGVNHGKAFFVQISAADAATTLSGSTLSLGNLTLNTTVRLELERIRNTYTVKLSNLTDNTQDPLFFNYTYPLTSAQKASGRLWKPAFMCVGGDHTLNSFKYESNCIKNSVVFLGDSITWGSYPDTIENHYPYLIENKIRKPVIINANSSNQTSDIISLLNDEVSFLFSEQTENKIAVFCIGVNDANQGVNIATFQNNINSILSTCDLNGILPIMCLIPPTDETTFAINSTINSFNKYLLSLSDRVIVDINTPLKNGLTDLNSIYDSGDGIHWNASGHKVVANLIYSKLKNYISI